MQCQEFLPWELAFAKYVNTRVGMKGDLCNLPHSKAGTSPSGRTAISITVSWLVRGSDSKLIRGLADSREIELVLYIMWIDEIVGNPVCQ
jgi:hypothetical protein